MSGSFWAAYSHAVFGDFIRFEEGDEGPKLPPGTPPTFKYTGPWLQTQLALSSAIGVTSFLLFTYARTRWPVLFAPRTKLKGFSPHDAHTHTSWFAWILPTIKTSEFTVLQIVGLDAAVLLNFFKMSFYLFSISSLVICAVMVPLNLYFGKDDDPGPKLFEDTPLPQPPGDDTDWYDIVNATNSYRATQLLFTYIFTGLVLRFVYRNYRRFVRARQLYSLELVHSIAARTVMITDLPSQLLKEQSLAIYFENMNLQVESVNVVRQAKSLNSLIAKRTEALFRLEQEWTKYVGNPSTVENYDPSQNVRSDTAPLVDFNGDAESQPVRVVVPHRRRPTIRPGWFKPKVDALEYYEKQFQELDEQVRKKRKSGKFKAAQTAFVTFEKMSSAQIATQVVHAPYQHPTTTCLAPEPRDIVWANMTLSPRTRQIRKLTVFAFMVLLFLFWIIPITTISAFLSYDEIKKTLPWLARLIDSNERVRAIVQNSLPSMAMVALNASLPFLLEGFAYLQGYQARSWIEYSLMRKYFLFLLVNVVFIFLFTSTYIQLVRDLADSPAKIPTKLAAALSQGKARSFFMSYVVLQALGIMPLQLLNLGVVLPRFLFLAIFTRTPRDFAELNAPPMINYGAVYPQALLVFVITVLYSIIQPFILVFGALYFGIGYVVYKYKLLFVFYKPYESQGQAWPITFVRLMWGVIIFQLLMAGIFTLEKYLTLAAMMTPLIAFTTYWTWTMDQNFAGLSDYVSLSSVFEVQRGEDSEDVVRLRSGHPVSWSQSHLNRRRYAQNDETLYVAPEDDRTDYSQPPMTNWYHGVLNTGKRRYGHPALTGVLPTPWLPLKKGQTLANYVDRDSAKAADGGNAVVLTLRRRASQVRKRGQALFGNNNQAGAEGDTEGGAHGVEAGAESSGGDNARAIDPWKDRIGRPISVASAPAGPNQLSRSPQEIAAANRLSYDPASGVIVLPEDDWFDDSDDDYGDSTPTPGGTTRSEASEHTTGGTDGGQSPTSPHPANRRHSTYFHHPERRRTIPGAFPRG